MCEDLLTDSRHINGLMIVCQPAQGAVGALPSHYFDRYAKQGAVRDALVRWFGIWAMAPDTDPKATGALETSTHEVLWCQELPQKLHGPQTVAWYAACAEHVLNEIDRYRPRVLLILSNYLYEALMSPGNYARLVASIGEAKLPAHRITQARLKALHQSFERCELLILPTPSRNTTDTYIAGLTAAVRQTFEAAGFALPEHTDRYLQAARSCLVIDREKTLGKFERQFQISRQEAQAIFTALVHEGVVSPPDSRGLQTLKVD